MYFIFHLHKYCFSGKLSEPGQADNNLLLNPQTICVINTYKYFNFHLDKVLTGISPAALQTARNYPRASDKLYVVWKSGSDDEHSSIRLPQIGKLLLFLNKPNLL